MKRIISSVKALAWRRIASASGGATSAGINTVDQLRAHLKGSNIGVASMSSGRIPYARAWIRELGLQEDTDVKLVAVGVGPQAAAALKADRVRALVIYDAVYAAIEAAKLGDGGTAYIATLLGCDPKTIRQGQEDLDHLPDELGDRVRKQGADESRA